VRRDAGQRAEPPVRAWEWPNPTGFVALDKLPVAFWVQATSAKLLVVQ